MVGQQSLGGKADPVPPTTVSPRRRSQPASGADPGSRSAPGPRGAPLVGSLLDMQRQGQVHFYVDAWRRHGDVVRFRMGPLSMHLVVRPEHVEHVHVHNRNNYTKGLGYAKVKLLVGLGLLTSEGHHWQRQRRLMQPPFTPRAVTKFAGTITEAAGEMLERWQAPAARGEALDINFEMMRLAATIIGRTMLSVDVGDETRETGRAFTYALRFLAERTIAILDMPLFVPTPANRRFKETMRTLDSLVYGLIADRRREPDRHQDLLALLLHAKDEETGEQMSDKELRDEVLTIFFAGHETTALAMSWAWLLLAQHLEAETKLHAELQTVLGGRVPSVDDLPQLPFTRMVVEETLRLYPPVWAFPRDALADDEIGGFRIPKGSMVLTSQYITHRHPEFWDRPEAFEPERFAPERVNGRPRYAYYPFGVGPRTCIGNNFAMLEAQLILASVAQRYRLVPVPGRSYQPVSLATLRPRENILMTLTPRSLR